MKVQVIVTEDSGHVIEHEGDAIIFCLRHSGECNDVCGVAGLLSADDLERMTGAFMSTVRAAIHSTDRQSIAKSILEDLFNKRR